MAASKHKGKAGASILPDGEDVHMPPLSGARKPIFHVKLRDELVDGLVAKNNGGHAADLFYVTFDSEMNGHIEAAGEQYDFSKIATSDANPPVSALTRAPNGALAVSGMVDSTLLIDARPASQKPARSSRSPANGANAKRGRESAAASSKRQRLSNGARATPSPHLSPDAPPRASSLSGFGSARHNGNGRSRPSLGRASLSSASPESRSPVEGPTSPTGARPREKPRTALRASDVRNRLIHFLALGPASERAARARIFKNASPERSEEAFLRTALDEVTTPSGDNFILNDVGWSKVTQNHTRYSSSERAKVKKLLADRAKEAKRRVRAATPTPKGAKHDASQPVGAFTSETGIMAALDAFDNRLREREPIRDEDACKEARAHWGRLHALYMQVNNRLEEVQREFDVLGRRYKHAELGRSKNDVSTEIGTRHKISHSMHAVYTKYLPRLHAEVKRTRARIRAFLADSGRE